MNFIVWHISDLWYGTPDMIRDWHQKQGWSTLGYHGVITNGYLTYEDWQQRRKVDWLDGHFHLGRTFDADGDIEKAEAGAHAYGLNSESVGLCLIGKEGKFSVRQIRMGLQVTRNWQQQLNVPIDHVIGHYEIGKFRPQFATDKTCPDINMDHIRELLRIEQDLGELNSTFNEDIIRLAS